MVPRIIIFILFFSIAHVFPQVQKARNGTELQQNSIYNSELITSDYIALFVSSNGILGEGLFYRWNSWDEGYYDLRELNPMLYVNGLMWGGRVYENGQTELRFGSQIVNSYTQPGQLFSNGQFENPELPEVDRVWWIRRDVFSEENLFILRDAMAIKSGFSIAPGDAKSVIIENWRNWPVEKGAPFYDVDGNGAYNPGFYEDENGYTFPKLRPKPGEAFDPDIHADEPGLADADEVIFLISNDFGQTDPNQIGTPRTPIGFEIQQTLWSYHLSRTQPTRIPTHSIFSRVRFIYKGTSISTTETKIDSLYIGIFGDPDIGVSGDDFVGYDKSLQMGYSYQSGNVDTYFSTQQQTPPAIGIQVLTGPVVPASGKTAFFNFKHKQDAANMPVQSFAHGGGDYAIYNGIPNRKLWNLLRGYQQNRPHSMLDPNENPTRFTLTGDPTNNSGWLDKGIDDRNFLMSFGPLKMALGDTNEVIFSYLGGVGYSRLGSIRSLKYQAQHNRQLAEDNFNLPHLPKAPEFSARSENNQIHLYWRDSSNALLQWQENGHRFEGISIYQVNENHSREHKLATFDLKNEVTNIVQPMIHFSTNIVNPAIVQEGTNSGLKWHFTLDKNPLENAPFTPGETYHFALTYYTYCTQNTAFIKSYESQPVYVSVQAQSALAQKNDSTSFGDSIPVVQTSGPSTQLPVVSIVNAEDIIGTEYEIHISPDDSNKLIWRLSQNDLTTTHQSGYVADFIQFPFIHQGFALKFPALNLSENATFQFSTQKIAQKHLEKQSRLESGNQINVFPNPFYRSRSSDRYPNHHVTFTHLPEIATIRIFTLAGVHVRTLEKHNALPDLKWNLQNKHGRLVGSGLYLAKIESPKLKKGKVLKLAVIY